jgi:hypothetical protein
MGIDYSTAHEFADAVRALAITESAENPYREGDGGRAFGLLQMHPSTFIRYYRSHGPLTSLARFNPGTGDTWTEGQIKACATYLFLRGYDRETQEERDLIVQAWNLGEHAVFEERQRNPEYLARFVAALDRIRGIGPTGEK